MNHVFRIQQLRSGYLVEASDPEQPVQTQQGMGFQINGYAAQSREELHEQLDTWLTSISDFNPGSGKRLHAVPTKNVPS